MDEDQELESQENGQQQEPDSREQGRGNAIDNINSWIGKVQGPKSMGGRLGQKSAERFAQRAAGAAVKKTAQAAASNVARGAAAEAATDIAIATSEIWVPIVFVLLIFLLCAATVIIVVMHPFGIPEGTTPGEGGPTPTPLLGGGGGGGTPYFANCTYYFQRQPMLLANPEVATFIQSVASKTGVPAPVIAGILRIEMSYFFGNSQASHFTNDYFDDPRAYRGPGYGVMQFIVPTFHAEFTNHQGEWASLYGKTSFSTAIESHSYSPTDTVARIVSIRDSIVMGAFYAKELQEGAVGRGGPWNETAVRAVAAGYQGDCSHGYCDDLWKSVRECEFNPGAEKVIQLVHSLNTACGPYIQSSGILNNIGCLSRVEPALPDSTRSIIAKSTSDNVVFQCVGFAQAANDYVQNPPIPYGRTYAKNYADPPPISGYRFIPKGSEAIFPGDTLIWNNDTSGHIGYAVSVIGDTINVAEANFCESEDSLHIVNPYIGCGKVNIKQHSLSRELIVGWLRKM